MSLKKYVACETYKSSRINETFGNLYIKDWFFLVLIPMFTLID